MPFRPNLGRVRARLTFANLTAFLALFVALGGSSYAALRVGSEQIANNSIRSKDIRNNNVRGRDIRKGAVHGTDIRNNAVKSADIRNDTIVGIDVEESSLGAVPNAQNAQNAQSAQNAQTLGGKPASAFLGSGAQQRTGLVKLAHGETKTVTSSGPFTWKAACTDAGGGSTTLTVTVETTEADSFAGSFDPSMAGPVSPNAPFEVFNSGPQPGSAYTIGFPLTAVAPSGAAPTGLAFVGLEVAGADCVVNGVLWP